MVCSLVPDPYQQGRYQHAAYGSRRPHAKPADQIVKFSDGGGLELWVFPDGAKRWRLAYRAGGLQKLLAIGVNPEVGLKDAREAREAAKKILADGVDPMAVKKQAKAEQAIASANTLEPSPPNWSRRSATKTRRIDTFPKPNGC